MCSRRFAFFFFILAALLVTLDQLHMEYMYARKESRKCIEKHHNVETMCLWIRQLGLAVRCLA